MSRPLSFLLLLLALPTSAVAAPPRFTVRDAVLAEWARQPIAMDAKAREKLPAADRARLLRAEQRIGVPGTPSLLPPELDKPEVATWEALAKRAKTPEERFTALHFLNRLKSVHALSALEGLTAADAKSWPKHLHLDAHVATARVRGEVVSTELQAFLAALPVDPVRAQAARVRLVLEGKEKELLRPIAPTPAAVLAVLDAWNKAPWEARKKDSLDLLMALVDGMEEPGPRALATLGKKRGAWGRLGLQSPTVEQLVAARWAMVARLMDGLGSGVPFQTEFLSIAAPRAANGKTASPDGLEQGSFWSKHLVQAVDGLQEKRWSAQREQGKPLDPPPPTWTREQLLAADGLTARTRYLSTVGAPPDFLDALVKRIFTDTEIDSLQALLEAFERLKTPAAQRQAVLAPFLQHPTWIARYEAWKALSAIDPRTPWPAAPPPTATEQAILDEAVRLAERGKPVRLSITFSAKRTVVLKLDPVNAPINVANLVLLARKGFFNGRRVPRVVPDFVVQMGSPLDTMDGGPGYAVRCEDSLDWYGPGTVGMALAGKDTGGSQFFLTTNATPHLTGRYTRVGEVEDLDRALPLLDALELGAPIERIDVLP